MTIVRKRVGGVGVGWIQLKMAKPVKKLASWERAFSVFLFSIYWFPINILKSVEHIFENCSVRDAGLGDQ